MRITITIGMISFLALAAFSQNTGVGISTPSQKLDVNGWIKVGNESAGSTATTGAIRYHSSGFLQFYNGSAWVSVPNTATTFTNWGRNDCPSTSSLVYAGYAAGHHYTHSGSGANTLCLTKTPSWSGATFNDGNHNASLIYGVEYEMSGYGIASFGNGLTSAQLQNYDAECAVCLVNNHGETLMIPGRNSCLAGWTLQYWGYLMANHYTQRKSEFVCVNNSPEQTGSNADSNGSLWYPTETEAGSLTSVTSAYITNREMTCAVCTK